MLIETGAVIAFVQMTFWLVIHNDPEPHSAAADAAGKHIFSSADSDTRNHMYVGVNAWLWMQTWKRKKEKKKSG